MHIWPGYTMRLTRTGPGDRSGSSRGLAVAARLVLAAAGLALIAAVATSASAGNPASLNVTLSTVTQAVKSVTVSPASTSYTNCKYGSSTTTQLGFPNGSCAAASTVAITNGATPASILINGADMVPADNGTHWKLCSSIPSDTPACTGSQIAPGSNLPGADEYYESHSPNPGFPLDGSGIGPFMAVKNTAVCDGFGPGCQATAGAQATEYLAIAAGPSSSSDPSTSWSTSVTWTAN
jgi:hypothetical protein